MFELLRVRGLLRTGITLVVCALVGSGIIQAAPGTLIEPSTADVALPAGGGLTRDTLEEASRPVPSIPSQPQTRRSPRSQRVLARRSVGSRSTPARRVAGRHRTHRRNVFESFVYWWNGWVFRRFHTHSGSLMLDRIGYKA